MLWRKAVGRRPIVDLLGGEKRLDTLVREERGRDIAGIHDVIRSAFGHDDEAILVDQLRDAGVLAVSMVLVVEDEPVAHAGVSPMSWVGYEQRAVVWALAPVSVKPENQRLGYGSQVVRATIDRCRAAGADVLTVLGNPKYYGRFGFMPASEHDLRIDGADFGNAFMVLGLTEGALSKARGSLRWHPAFDQLGDG